ncbi:hypothetical protein AVEN_76277-1 [Araneus ventricosus]|uniref:Uncharacterized protein n=1 Tax=Araneus ventricosus TaxID=182803 RepID=A0A4Y2TBX7_ARAVE|nr:hypothetical protein AVEN_76277-1 [Araneus ventricosus]
MLQCVPIEDSDSLVLVTTEVREEENSYAFSKGLAAKGLQRIYASPLGFYFIFKCCNIVPIETVTLSKLMTLLRLVTYRCGEERILTPLSKVGRVPRSAPHFAPATGILFYFSNVHHCSIELMTLLRSVIGHVTSSILVAFLTGIFAGRSKIGQNAWWQRRQDDIEVKCMPVACHGEVDSESIDAKVGLEIKIEEIRAHLLHLLFTVCL